MRCVRTWPCLNVCVCSPFFSSLYLNLHVLVGTIQSMTDIVIGNHNNVTPDGLFGDDEIELSVFLFAIRSTGPFFLTYSTSILSNGKFHWTRRADSHCSVRLCHAAQRPTITLKTFNYENEFNGGRHSRSYITDSSQLFVLQKPIRLFIDVD